MIYLLLGILIGLVLAPTAILTLGSVLPDKWSTKMSNYFIKIGLGFGDRWLLVERGRGDYDLIQTETDEETGEEVHGDEYFEDPAGLMGRLFGKPFGIAYGKSTVISSPLVSKIGEEMGGWKTDGGNVEDIQEERSLQWYRENALMGTFSDGNYIYEIVNGAKSIPGAGAVADVRETVNLLSYGADPNMPERTASNAENSEAARRGDAGWKETAGKMGYLMMGGLLVYIGTGQAGDTVSSSADSVSGQIVAPQLLDLAVMIL